MTTIAAALFPLAAAGLLAGLGLFIRCSTRRAHMGVALSFCLICACCGLLLGHAAGARVRHGGTLPISTTTAILATITAALVDFVAMAWVAVADDAKSERGRIATLTLFLLLSGVALGLFAGQFLVNSLARP